MATEVATEIATSVANSLLARVKRELKFWASSSDYVKDMHKKVSVLDAAATDMGERRVAFKTKRQMVPARVPGWLEDANDIKVRADVISTHGVGCSNIKMRYRAGKDSAAIVEEIDSLMTEKDKMLWTDDIVPLARVSPPRPTTSVAVHEDNRSQNKIKSRDSLFSDALKSLEADNINTQKIALYGMGGVGKTTMMNQLEKAARDKYIFPSIVKVEVGRNPNLPAVQQKVAELIGGALIETDTNASAENLKKRFEAISEEGKKKVLLILDNVWEVFNLKHIGLTSPLPNGFKLLLTSREETVCRQMGVEASSIFRMTPLEESEGKQLFWETTGLGSVSNIEGDLYKIGEEIIKRCGGLPLAITAIASALGDDKEKDEWADALSRLNNTSIDDYEFNEHFKISYENLKEDDLKAIFLLSGLFPEANNVSKEDLLWYGWGLKFFRDVDTIAEARRRVNTCVNKLIRSNLLIKGDQEGSVKIHDLVRDFVLSNFTEVKQGSNISKKLKEEESYERVLFKCEDTFELPVDFNHQNLKLLMVTGNFNRELKFPEGTFAKLQKLEVLAYENMFRLFLPRHSTNLRVLSISWGMLVDDDIPFLGDLVNLEVLSIAGCGIHKLPSEIEKLRRLKVLNVTENLYDLCIDICVLQSLDRLEELYLGDITFTNANSEDLKMFLSKLSALVVNFHTNKEEAKHMSFEKLERFMISIGRRTPLDTSDADEDTNVDSFKNTANLVISKSELIDYKMNELFSKTEILYLEVSDMNHLGDVATNPSQHNFCNLKALDVFNCTDLAYLFTVSVAKGLTKLESLKICQCPVLKSVVKVEDSEVEAIEFQKLKILYLVDLPELKSLCDPTRVVRLPQLVELGIRELNNFTSNFHENSIITSAKQLCLSTEMPKLEKLALLYMQNLKEIWPCEFSSSEAEVNNSSMLREIKLEECNSLVNLFPRNPMQLLGHLEVLSIEDCDSIEVLFNIDLGKTEQLSSNNLGYPILLFPCLYSLTLESLVNLKHIGSGGFSMNFPNLKILKILFCPRLENIFTFSTIDSLKKLEKLTITGCMDLKVIVTEEYGEHTMEDVFFPHLKSIELSHLQNLQGFFLGTNIHFQLPLLEAVKIINCPQMMAFTSGRLTTPRLKYVTTELGIHRFENGLNFHETSSLLQTPSTNSEGKAYSLHNLIEMKKVYGDERKILIPTKELLQLQKLETIYAEWCTNAEEVFEVALEVSNNESKSVVNLPNLREVELKHLDSLKYIWKSNQWRILEFPNLTRLSIYECGSLEHVFTCSMVSCVMQLQELHVEHCRNMKVIVKEDEDWDATFSEINFPRLKSLKLEDLEMLEAFCLGKEDFTFSSLNTLEIEKCKKITVFTEGRSTALKLGVVKTNVGSLDVGEDINIILTKIQEAWK